MYLNLDKPHLWKSDIARSVDFYNQWFIEFAPQAYRDTRRRTIHEVEAAFEKTSNLTEITPGILASNPAILETLRMSTAPPITRDRLIGLTQVSLSLVESMEKKKRLPAKMTGSALEGQLEQICRVIERLMDGDLFPWLADKRQPDDAEVHRAATIVADRLCGALSDPIIRNAQERRQLRTIEQWLLNRGYTHEKPADFRFMRQGTFAFRSTIPITQEGSRTVNLPVDILVMPLDASEGDFPLFLEAKSSGDFTITTKRRKEEAGKAFQLRNTYGDKVRFMLMLCGYFDSGYLGYEAAEGIDWIWEHRLDDLAQLGL
jgi:hypothetical protein